MYLNKIYFGAGFYGVQAAARGYFGKDVKDLALEESATLSGLIKSPNRLSPIKHPEESIESRNMVLGRMLEEGHISREEHARLVKLPMITMAQAGGPAAHLCVRGSAPGGDEARGRGSRRDRRLPDLHDHRPRAAKGGGGVDAQAAESGGDAAAVPAPDLTRNTRRS